MSKQRRKGISFGTVFAVALTVLVVGVSCDVIRKISGTGELMPDIAQVIDDANNAAEVTAAPENAAPQQEELEPLATLAPTSAPRGGSFTCAIGGSIMIDNVLRQSAYFESGKSYDFMDIFSGVAGYFKADLSVVSFENLICPGEKLSDTVTCDDTMQLISSLGVNTVAAGFPGAYKKGANGVQSTVKKLQKQDVRVVGLFQNAEEAAPQNGIIRLGNVNVAVLEYVSELSSQSESNIRKDDAAWAVPVASSEKIAADIAGAKRAGAEFVIVMVNWGDAGKSSVTAQQMALAQSIANGGADVIIGLGCRPAQPIVTLDATTPSGAKKQVLCAYSLGGLLSSSRTNGGVAAMILKLTVTVDPQGIASVTHTVVPTFIWRYKQDGRSYYRVIDSSLPAPDGMTGDIGKSMKNAYENIVKLY